MSEKEVSPIELSKRGDVTKNDVEYAIKRIETVMGLVGAPILSVRVRLTRDDGGRRLQPSIAQATFNLNGELIRAQVVADQMTEAIDLLAARLRDQLHHRAERRRSRRVAQAGEWRLGDDNGERTLFAEVPADEREVVHTKSFAVHPATPDEAAADMEQMDHDFWLFRDLASDADAVLEHLPEGGYRLQRSRAATTDDGPVAIELDVVEHLAPRLALREAISQLDDGGQRFVFFVDPDSERGNIVYLRYDGNYGVLSPI